MFTYKETIYTDIWMECVVALQCVSFVFTIVGIALVCPYQ